jgi:GNAT superfamily N-acetyltransferase
MDRRFVDGQAAGAAAGRAAGPNAARGGAGATCRHDRTGDSFHAWETRISDATRLALKQPGEVASAAAIERDIAAVPSDPRLWLVAAVPERRRGERIVAFASGSIEFGYRLQYDCFVNVAVLPEWSGQGIGRALYERIEAWGSDRGVRRLTAAIQAPNGAGRAFAAALGYGEEVTMRCYSLIDGRMVDRLRVGKLLIR